MSVKALFQPLKLSAEVTMKNRFVVSALTRCRAGDDHVPTDDMVKYYSDRAGFGLILTEATQIEKGYSTFAREGGIYGPAQIAGWKRVTDAVHAKGGLIFCQIHHGGRATVPSNLEAGKTVVGPCDVGIAGHECNGAFAMDGNKQPYPTPRELTVAEIKEHVNLYVEAAKNCIKAGFDGVEIHGANGYLIDQFLRTKSNKRTDAYGGSLENRSRFLLEVVDGVCAAIGAGRVGLRISPLNAFNDMSDENPEELTTYVCKELNSRKLAFLDVLRSDFFSPTRGADKWARKAYTGVVFSGMGYTPEEAEKEIAAKEVDAVCFGTLSIANPDLVARVQAGAALNAPDPATFYSQGPKGYIDYPMM